MRIYATFWKPNAPKPGLGTLGRSIWFNWKGGTTRAKNRAAKLWPDHIVELEFCLDDRPYSAPLQTLTFYTGTN